MAILLQYDIKIILNHEILLIFIVEANVTRICHVDLDLNVLTALLVSCLSRLYGIILVEIMIWKNYYQKININQISPGHK